MLYVHFQVSSSEYSDYEESETESLAMGPTISIDPLHGGKSIKKTQSMASYQSDNLETDADFQELEANMDVIDEYYYGVRVFPGQDPNQVYIGWVTPQFHMYEQEFDLKKVRHVVVHSLDVDGGVRSRYVIQALFSTMQALYYGLCTF